MAEAKEINKKIPRQITVHDDVTIINLELTKDEAAFLKALMGKIAGPENGLRGIAKDISTALHAVIGPRYFVGNWWFENQGPRSMAFGRDTTVEDNISSEFDW